MYITRSSKVIALCLCLLLAVPAQRAEAKTSNTRGIDVSAYNGTVDWEAVAEQGYTFAMIRIAEGQAPDVDAQFEVNYAGARAAGLKVGVYHDCCIRTPEAAVLEAKYCLELLNGRELDYPVAYDIEKPGSFAGGIQNTTSLAKSYCDVIAAAGYTPMIYSSASHLNQDFSWDQLTGIKIWVAHYEVGEATFSGSYDLWQYTNRGVVEGANTDRGYCDINYSFLEAESIRFIKSKSTLGIGETLLLDRKLTPDGCTDSIRFTSSDKSIATVNSKGKVTAKASGKVTITAVTGSGVTATATITVKKAPKALSLSTAFKKLKTGTSYQIKPVLSSGSASNQITYKSSNTKVASVNSNGTVKAKKAGSATITVTTYNGKTAHLKVTVK